MTLTEQAVKDIAIQIPGVTAIFRRYRIDFCCNGGRSLVDAAKARGVDATTLVAEIQALEPREPDVDQGSPGALIGYIIERFHETHRRELPELLRLARRVQAVHGNLPTAPHGLVGFLEELAGGLEDHMLKEEMILFPMLSSGHGAAAGLPIAKMRAEHADHGNDLDALAALTNDFTPPDGACTTWRALYAGLGKLDGDLREHIHLENNVLFPMFEPAGTSEGTCGCGHDH